MAEREIVVCMTCLVESDGRMNWEEAEQLAEHIRAESPKPIVVLGIEPFGPASRSSYTSDFFVKCGCKITGLQFVVKSFEHWEDLKQHVIVRICKPLYRLIQHLM